MDFVYCFRMFSFRLLLLCILQTILIAAKPNKLPPNWKVCRRGPTINKCLEESAESAMRSLEKGYPPLDIPSLDPLILPNLDVIEGTGRVNIKVVYENFTISGLKNIKMRDFKTNFENNIVTLSSSIYVPKIILDSLYEITGKILIIPIKGKGTSRLVLYENTGNWTLVGKKYKKDNREYMKVTDFKFNIDPTKTTFNLKNLFNGNKLLGDNMNRFLNDNHREVIKEMKPIVQEKFGIKYADIANRIFNRIPLDQLFVN